ncbi:MAG: peptide deformylase [Clostridia bacterium]|nr:peptide deformylase [Clostridia bacterium]
MAILKIVTEDANEEFLRKKSREVTEITPRINTLIDDMIETMRHANGCGLAAVQIGVLRRIVVIETEDDGLFVFINPEIIAKAGEQESAEGCLSLPGKWGLTKRPMYVTVRALDRNGKKIEVRGEGLLAKAMCHELDHLDGILYTDKTIRMLKEEELQ